MLEESARLGVGLRGEQPRADLLKLPAAVRRASGFEANAALACRTRTCVSGESVLAAMLDSASMMGGSIAPRRSASCRKTAASTGACIASSAACSARVRRERARYARRVEWGPGACLADLENRSRELNARSPLSCVRAYSRESRFRAREKRVRTAPPSSAPGAPPSSARGAPGAPGVNDAGHGGAGQLEPDLECRGRG